MDGERQPQNTEVIIALINAVRDVLVHLITRVTTNHTGEE